MVKVSKTKPTESDPQIATAKETRNLKTTLTAKELARSAEELATTIQEISRLEAEMTSLKAQIKSKIEEAISRRGRLADVVATKSEFRLVDCAILIDYSTKTYTATREDTWEVVEERPLFESELQRKLPIGGPK